MAKAKRLAELGFADVYLLITNASVTGTVAAELATILRNEAGVEQTVCYGREWICDTIAETPRLRRLVPRLYGLGDLAQILDQRSYEQAESLLSVLGEDLKKFVFTDAYEKSANALDEHGFVLLLGQPAAGKSMIATALAAGALDEWGCSVIRVNHPQELEERWNPHERQFFWVDDAFGATQLDRSSLSAWNKVLPMFSAVMKGGSKVLMTSRDYIYAEARRGLKMGIFPLLKESEVVIDVEKLKHDERAQILYNHLKFGSQSREYKTRIKPFLPAVASSTGFLPEVARRLGDRRFTGKLRLEYAHILKFVEEPEEILLDTIRGLDLATRTALGVIFMSGGRVEFPLDQISDPLSGAIRTLGSDLADVKTALGNVRGSFTILEKAGSRQFWRFKHPTIHDAYGKLVAEEPEHLEIYLLGVKIDALVGEIVCGALDVYGAKIFVPAKLYPIVARRLDELSSREGLFRFLKYRADHEFLRTYVESHPSFVPSLRLPGKYLEAFPETRVFARLHACGMLPEALRRKMVEDILSGLKFGLDDGFLADDVRAMFTPDEFKRAVELARKQILEDVEGEVESWKDNFSSDDDPEDFFDGLKSIYRRFDEFFWEDQELKNRFETLITSY